MHTQAVSWRPERVHKAHVYPKQVVHVARILVPYSYLVYFVLPRGLARSNVGNERLLA